MTMRIAFLSAAMGVVVFGCGAANGAAAPEDLSVTELQAEMAAGRWTSADLVQYFVGRIEKLDRSGPHLAAVIELNPDAAKIAAELDKERREKGPRGPLHGIPILLKDNIDTADGMMTTAGSLALVGSRPSRDAFIVQRLREAGAVILGKTNLSEWANFRSSRSSSGWSGRGGQTRNPYDTARTPSGSSSGSGVAVAAGLCVVAVGTETDGSIVSPASTNGIVGIKPTVGLVSRRGIIPISASQDTAGPMARSVTDAAILLAVLAGRDSDDAATARSPGSSPDYVAALRSDGLRGARIGVARNLAGFHEGVDAVLNHAIETLKASGAVIVDPADLKISKKVGDDEMIVLQYEFKDGLNRYLQARPGAPESLAALIDFNTRQHDSEMPYFEQEIFLSSQKEGPLTDRNYLRALRRSRAAAGPQGIDAVLRKYKLDAIVAPTDGPATMIDLVNGDHWIGGGSSQAPAVAGYPHITVPAGYVHGLPVGLSFIGTAWSEAMLIRLAYAFEQSARARKPPVLVHSLPEPRATARTAGR